MAETWDLVITCGQSQMVGHAYPPNPWFGYEGPPGTNPDKSTEYVNDPTWDTPGFYEVMDPAYPNQPQYSGRNGSCLPSFVNLFARGTGRKICVVRAAVDGTAMLATNEDPAKGNWSPTGDLYGDMVALVEDALVAIAAHPAGVTIGDAFLICSVGGKDAGEGKDASNRPRTDPLNQIARDFADATKNMLANFWVDVPSLSGCKLYLEEMYRVPGLNVASCDAVKAGQHLAVSEDPNIEIAFDLGSTFSGNQLILDGIHYGQPGLNIMGEEYARYILDDLGYAPAPPAPLGETSYQAMRLMAAPRVPPLPRTFSLPGTYSWTCPVGVTSIDVTAWGAGAGGKGGVALSTGGGGGGSGEKRVRTAIPVTPGNVYTIIIGAGGLGRAYNTGGTGIAGGDTSFDGATVTAKGGLGGGLSQARNGGAGGTGGSGGTGTNGNAGGTAANVANSDGGAGGSAPGGGGAGGAAGIASPNHVGGSGTAPGGGGGGGRGNVGGANGGPGADGRLTITEH